MKKLIAVLCLIAVLLSACSVPTTPAAKSTIVGNWAWFNNENVSIYPDGTAVNHASRIVGEWRYDPEAKTYLITWYPEGCEDTLALSVDGKTLDGFNDDGVHVFGNRIES